MATSAAEARRRRPPDRLVPQWTSSFDDFVLSGGEDQEQRDHGVVTSLTLKMSISIWTSAAETDVAARFSVPTGDFGGGFLAGKSRRGKAGLVG